MKNLLSDFYKKIEFALSKKIFQQEFNKFLNPNINYSLLELVKIFSKLNKIPLNTAVNKKSTVFDPQCKFNIINNSFS